MPSKKGQHIRHLPVAKSFKQCQSMKCKISEADMRLLACAKCKTSYYCSRLCQKEDWSRHKILCRLTIENQEVMKTKDQTLYGYTCAEVDRKMKIWTQIYRPMLSHCAVNALILGDGPGMHPEIAETHAFCVWLTPNPPTVDGKTPSFARSFIVTETFIGPLMDALTIMGDLEEEFHLKNVEMLNEDRKAYASSVIIVLLVPLLKILRVVPDGFHGPMDFESMRVPNCESRFKQCVRDGIAL